MKVSKYKKLLNLPIRQATLCFLLDNGKVLLGMKKRGFGKGLWNGFGGKPKQGESIFDTALREVSEETGVIPKDLINMATLNFYFPQKPEWNQEVIVYTSSKWQGTPEETEEMKPKWFKFEDVPYKKMWWDDIYWLPNVLQGKEVAAKFLFKTDGKTVDDYKIEIGNDRKDKLSLAVENVLSFNKARGWTPVPGDIAKSIIIEGAELLEHFQWDESDRNIKGIESKDWNDVAMEVADVFWYLVSFCNATNINLADAVKKKMEKLAVKYPVEKFNGKHNDKFYKAQKKKYREGRK